MQPRDTEHLTFRSVTMTDAQILHELNHAPGVMQYLERVPPPIEYLRTKTIPERMSMSQEHPGYGMWIASFKQTGEFVGRFGLRPNSPNDGDAEIGYRILPNYWGQGLGSEGAREVLRYALEDLQAERFVAITMAVNSRSRAVMERIGLTYIRTFYVEFEDPLPGTEQGEVEYAMTRAEWSQR